MPALSEQGSSAASSFAGPTADQQAVLEGDLDGDGANLQTAVLGILYTVNKEKSIGGPLWTTFRLLTDWLQIWLLMVNPLYGFNISASDTTWQIFNFIQLNAFMSARGYTFFIITLYIFVLMLITALSISIWIGYSFQANRFNALWPIVFLRSFSTVFFQVLDIASMSLFIIALDCQYWNAPPGRQFHNQEYLGVQCFAMPHLIHAGVAGISLAVFVVMATLFTAGEMELNPISCNVMAMGHSQVEVYGFLIKVLMTCASSFLGSLRWQSIVQLTFALMLMWLYIKWVPMLYNWVNHVRCASFATILYAGLMFVLIVYELGIDPTDPAAVTAHRKRCTTALYAGTVPAALLGGLASWLRLRYFHTTVMTRISSAPSDVKPKSLYKFTDGRQVEMLLRCCRVWVDEDTVEPTAVARAELVLKCAMGQLPKDPYVIILYSSFLIEVQSSYQTGYAQLQAAKKADPPFLMRFAIFSREQAHTQRSASTGASGPVDLVGYVELQRNYRMALKVHRDALLATRAFWACILHWNVSLNTLSKAVKRIDVTVKAAERVYKAVMRRHVNNAQMLRMYATFLEGIKHDPWGATRWFAEADKLEDQEERAKNDDVFKLGDIASLRTAMGHMSDSNVGTSSKDVRGVIVIDAQGIVQMVNQGALDMFGYTKVEVKGKNISMLVPPPFTEHHNTFLRNYITTGKEVVLNRTSEMIALHKERYVVPIELSVTKVSGIGEDTMFLGVLEAVMPSAYSAKVWVTANGQVVSVDSNFTDWTGLKMEDVTGRDASSLVQEDTHMHRLLACVRSGKPPPPEFAPEFAAPPLVRTGAALASMDGFRMPTQTMATAAPTPHASDPQLMPGYQFSASGKVNDNAERKGGWKDEAYTVDAAVARRSEAGRAVGDLMNSLRRVSGTGDKPAAGIAALPTPHKAMSKPLEWVTPSVHFFHKYCNPVEMAVTVTTAGIGAFTLHVLTLHRAPPLEGKSHHKIVSDARGRVVHATAELATLLGTTTTQLLANNSSHAVEKIMAQPFAQMHRTLATSIPATAPPPYSCRSGLSILLAGTGPRGAYTLPFRISSLQRRLALEEPYHVMNLTQRTVEQAIGERCLELTIGMDGRVIAVGDSPVKLFGFHPSVLLGQHLAAVIDVFKGTDDSTAAPKLLVQLAKRALKAPGLSINVAVAVPTPQYGDAASREVMAELLADVMTVVVEGAQDNDGLPPANGALMSIKLQLWRSDLLTGVLQLDDTGHVMASHQPMPMYPCGPMFGVPAEAMIGNFMSKYLPLSSKNHWDLLKPSASSTKAAEEMNLGRRRRSSMKLDKPCRPDEVAAEGVAHVMRIQHMVDGQELKLSVVALKRTAGGSGSSAGSMYLVMRILSGPAGGRPGLLEYLLNPSNSTVRHMASLIPGSESQADLGGFAPRLLAHSRHSSMALDSSSAFGNGMPPLAAKNAIKWQAIGDHAISRRNSNLGLPGTPTLPPPEVLADESYVPIPDPLAPVRSASGLMQLKDGDGEVMTEALDNVRTSGNADRAPALSPFANGRLASVLSASPSLSRGKAVRFGEEGAPPTAPSPAPAADSAVLLEVPQDRVAMWVKSAGASMERHGSMDADIPDDVHSVDGADGGGSQGGSSIGSGERTSGGGDNLLNLAADASDIDEQPDDATAVVTDYKRGSRFKKIMRLFSTDAVQVSKSRFRLHSICLVIFLLLAHIGAFILMYQLLTVQRKNVEALNTAGLAARYANEMTITVRDIDIILSKMYVPDVPAKPGSGGPAINALKGLSGPGDLQPTLERFYDLFTGFKKLHSQTYLDYVQGSTASADLKSIWTKENLTESAFYEVPLSQGAEVFANSTTGYSIHTGTSSPNNVTVPTNMTIKVNKVFEKVSLWNLGNRLAAKGQNIYQNALAYNASLAGPINSTAWGKWADVQWIIANVPANLSTGYFDTLDSMVVSVIADAAGVNSAQMILLIVEGVVLCLLAVLYMGLLSRSIATYRYVVYTMFLMVPTAMVRALASEPINLPDEDDDGTGDFNNTVPTANLATLGGAGATAMGGGDVKLGKTADMLNRSSTGNINMVGLPGDDSAKEEEGSAVKKSWSTKLRSLLTLWKPRSSSKVNPTGTKDAKRTTRLQRSMSSSVLLSWPIVLWGVIVVIVNAVGHKQLSQISLPIALFTTTNFVTVRYQRHFSFLQEFAFNTDPTLVETKRNAYTVTLDLLGVEYRALLFGGVGVNSTRPHFNLTKQGIATMDGPGNAILYQKNACLCPSKSQCTPSDNPYYGYVSQGLDRAVQHLFEILKTVRLSTGVKPNLWGPEFGYYWTSHDEIRCGLGDLNSRYQQHVIAQYTGVLSLHIIVFVLTWIILLAYALFIVRPFVAETAAETRRIAELLSELPPEVDVEGLINRILVAKYVPLGAMPVADTSNKTALAPFSTPSRTEGSSHSMKRSMSLRDI